METSIFLKWLTIQEDHKRVNWLNKYGQVMKFCWDGILQYRKIPKNLDNPKNLL